MLYHCKILIIITAKFAQHLAVAPPLTARPTSVFWVWDEDRNRQGNSLLSLSPVDS